MSTLNPPIPLEKPDNQARVDYIQDYASGEGEHQLSHYKYRFHDRFVSLCYVQGPTSTIRPSSTRTLRSCGTIVAYSKRMTDRMSIN